MTLPASPTIDEGFAEQQWEADLPKIADDDHFVDVVRELSIFFVDEITLPYTFEQFRTTSAGDKLRILVDYLVCNTENKVIISALLTLKWHFSTLTVNEPQINKTRANACEIVAWRYLSRLSERCAVDFCLYEIEPLTESEQSLRSSSTDVSERSALLPRFQSRRETEISRPTSSRRNELEEAVLAMGSNPTIETPSHQHNGAKDPTSSFIGLTALEIAVVSDSKKFLSQPIIQKIITGIWKGDIQFWADLNEHTEKKPQFHDRAQSDPYARLRVPKYIKLFEVFFFACFLMLYYAVLIERDMFQIYPSEILLYVWFAAFAYDEFSEFMGAGTMVYSVDIWNGFDAIIILIGATFMGTRFLGVYQHNDELINTSFDILSLEALFMVPRLCSLLSLVPYFATLIPALKAMIRDFVKFMVIVGIMQIGFFTTFSLLARESFTAVEMSWILTRVFFGGSGGGFDVMHKIDPRLGPPLMIIYVCMTNVLLVTSLVCVLRESFSRVMANANEEHLYVYSVYVLEASTSNSRTHFYPPLNLVPLICLKPLRLICSVNQLRKVRILLVKLTHFPIVYFIFALEHLPWKKYDSGEDLFSSAVPATTRILFEAVKAKEAKVNSNSNSNGKPAKSYFSSPGSRNQSNAISGAVVRENFNGSSMLKAAGVDKSTDIDCAKDIAVVKEREAELEEKVARLSEQIAELTALIMKRQSISGGSGID